MKCGLFSLCVSAVGCVLALQFPSRAIARSQETVLHSFAGAPDGAYPDASLIEVKGTLYGTTSNGGGNAGCGKTVACGTVFSLDPNTGTEKVLYSFCSRPNCTDGNRPDANLIDVKGMLYGTTEEGGAYDSGTVFAVTR